MKGPIVVAMALVAAGSAAFAQGKAGTGTQPKLTPEQEAEKARLEKYDKPLQKDITFEVLTGGAIKGAIAGSAAKAGAAVATGAVTKGGAEAGKQKVKAYKKARKVKIEEEAEPPINYGGQSGGAQK